MSTGRSEVDHAILLVPKAVFGGEIRALGLRGQRSAVARNFRRFATREDAEAFLCKLAIDPKYRRLVETVPALSQADRDLIALRAHRRKVSRRKAKPLIAVPGAIKA